MVLKVVGYVMIGKWYDKTLKLIQCSLAGHFIDLAGENSINFCEFQHTGSVVKIILSYYESNITVLCQRDYNGTR